MSRWPRIPLSGSLRRTAPDRESTWKNREPSRKRNPGSREGTPMKKLSASSSESSPRNWLTRVPTAVFSGKLQDRSATMVGGVLHWAAQNYTVSYTASFLGFQGRILPPDLPDNKNLSSVYSFFVLFCFFLIDKTVRLEPKNPKKFEESYINFRLNTAEGHAISCICYYCTRYVFETENLRQLEVAGI